MDTSEVAEKLGTTPRLLRAFLRSGYSTFVPVGSGSRYDFTEKEFPTIEKRFTEWKASGKPRPEAKPKTTTTRKSRHIKPSSRDAEVWAEEGTIVLEDIRDPRVRARVRRDAQAADDRLTTMLVAKGVHVAQGWTASRRAS